MPNGAPSILGLGLKFCLKHPRPTNKIEDTIKRFTEDVRRISWVKNNPREEEPGEITYIRELYIKGTEWEPPRAEKDIERAISSFANDLRQECKRYRALAISNLTPRQWKQVQALREDLRFIIIEADKNLGGCILLRDTYIARAISQHLSNKEVYKPLTKHEAKIHQNYLRSDIRDWMATWRSRRVMSKAEYQFLYRYIDNNRDRHARFRMSLKAHKTPWKCAPLFAAREPS